MAASADKVLQAGNPNVINCERGSQFGYTDLVVDTRSLPLMRRATPWALVAADVTHALQQPAARALEVPPPAPQILQ
jgi:2-dehydro-3-deoxyphosphooctonate aldolase (KDO 8-P synthase)